MVQLRQDFDRFTEKDAIIVAIGPENAMSFKKYWDRNKIPFIGLPDEKQTVLQLYGQEINLFKLGRMPAQMMVDKQGNIRYVHYGHSMSDIPSNKEILGLLDTLESESG
jgi:peroxiredoxin